LTNHENEDESVESGVDDDTNWSVPNVEEPLGSPTERVVVVESGPELQVSVVDEESNPYSKDVEFEEDARDGQFIVAGLDSQDFWDERRKWWNQSWNRTRGKWIKTECVIKKDLQIWLR